MKLFRYLIVAIFFCIPHCIKAQYSYITFLKDVTLSDLPVVGGKNASLGQMISALHSQNIRVPHGFAITVDGYARYIDYNNLSAQITHLTSTITDTNDLKNLKKISAQIRTLIEDGQVPTDLATEINSAYQQLSLQYNEDNCDVAVRSSATAEDLPDA